MVKNCVIPDCGHNNWKTAKKCSMFLFPNPNNFERVKKWVRASGVEDLVYLPLETLRTQRCICACHFLLDQFADIATKKRLKGTAVPRVMGVEPLSDEVMRYLGAGSASKIETRPVLTSLIGPTPKSLVNVTLNSLTKVGKLALVSSPSNLNAVSRITQDQKRDSNHSMIVDAQIHAPQALIQTNANSLEETQNLHPLSNVESVNTSEEVPEFVLSRNMGHDENSNQVMQDTHNSSSIAIPVSESVPDQLLMNTPEVSESSHNHQLQNTPGNISAEPVPEGIDDTQRRCGVKRPNSIDRDDTHISKKKMIKYAPVALNSSDDLQNYELFGKFIAMQLGLLHPKFAQKYIVELSKMFDF